MLPEGISKETHLALELNHERVLHTLCRPKFSSASTLGQQILNDLSLHTDSPARHNT